MKEIKLYRESNGQYSTSEARQDDVSGYYVQKTDYDELRVEHYDSRAKVQDLEKENAELLSSVSRLVFAMTEDIHKTGDNFRLQDALDKTPAQHLADIKADAIMEVANNWIIRKGSDFNIRRKLTAISNKIRGESCVSIKSQSN